MTNQKHTPPSPSPDTIDTKPPRDILSIVLSFIGLGRSNCPRDDDTNRSLYSSSFSSTSTKVASTTTTTATTAASSSHYTYNDTDQSTLYYTEETMSNSSSSSLSLPPTPTSSNNDQKYIEESAVFIPSVATPTSEHPPDHHSSLYDSWAFQDWLRRLPKMALFHLVSSTAMKDPMMAYHLMECQYMDDVNNNNKNSILTSTSTTATTTIDHHPSPCDNNMTRILINEIAWIQTHTRAILHQLDHLRPNEQFAKAKDIADQLLSMIRLCGHHFMDAWGGDSWLTVMTLILVAQECLDDTPAEIRQYLFYRVKVGRLLILEMNTVLKNYKIYQRDRRTSTNNAQQETDRRDTTTTTTPQQYVAHYFFSSQRGGWRDALEMVCHHLARLDDGWKFRNEYQEAMTLAANIL